MMGQFIKAGFTEAKRELKQFPVNSPEGLVPVGTQILARHFTPGQFVDVSGTTKGKGFQGVMKKYGFAGQPASHGTSLAHRSLGSTGNRKTPGRVFLGKKMPGRMGNVRRTAKNLLVFKINTRENLLFVRGAVPGSSGSFVEVKDATYSPIKTFFPPFPTYIPKPGVEEPEELTYDSRVSMKEKDEWLLTEDEKNARASKQRTTAAKVFGSLAAKLSAVEREREFLKRAGDAYGEESLAEIFKREKALHPQGKERTVGESGRYINPLLNLKSRKKRAAVAADTISKFGVALHGESDDQLSLDLKELSEDSEVSDDDNKLQPVDRKKKEKKLKERKKEKKGDVR